MGTLTQDAINNLLKRTVAEQASAVAGKHIMLRQEAPTLLPIARSFAVNVTPEQGLTEDRKKEKND